MLSQKWYYYVQYTDRHRVVLISLFVHDICQSWPTMEISILQMACAACSANQLKNKYHVQIINLVNFGKTGASKLKIDTFNVI